MPTLLMLAFEFPPMSGIGMLRSFKLTKSLPEHGLTPVVVTTDSASLDAWFGRTLDTGPLDELPDDLAIHRVPCPRPPIPGGLWARRLRHFFSIGEEDIGRQWGPHLTSAWDRLVAESTPAAVYVSVPPFSIAPLAVKLARRSGLPVILDFRDNWSQWCHSPYTTWLHYQLVLWRERACLEQASAIVATTAQIVRDLQAAHPHVDRRKFRAIPSGYDAPLLPVAAPREAATAARPFVIGYVGSFYYLPQLRASVMEPWYRLPPRHWLHYTPRREDWLYRTPFFFFRALQRLFEARPELRATVKVRFVGDSHDWLRQQVEHFGLQDVVEHLGRLPHAATLEFEARCDALLATSAKVIGGRDPYIAGKTFEYLTSGRPVVAVVAAGEQRDFLQESGIALMCDPDDPALSAHALEQLVTGRFVPHQNVPFLKAFQSSEVSRKLAAVVSEL
ncbi:MAG: glycosyltransferase [Vicinamibacterales bacterium]